MITVAVDKVFSVKRKPMRNVNQIGELLASPSCLLLPEERIELALEQSAGISDIPLGVGDRGLSGISACETDLAT
jgi:hypothetical protein